MRGWGSLLLRLAARTSLGRRLGLDRAWRAEAFRRYVDARRLASDSSDIRDYSAVGRAYRAFLRTYLRPIDQRLVDLENDVEVLRRDVRAIRGERKDAGVPRD